MPHCVYFLFPYKVTICLSNVCTMFIKNEGLRFLHPKHLPGLFCKIFSPFRRIRIHLRKCRPDTLFIGGSKGGARDVRPPDPNSVIFMQFLGNFWPNNRLVPPPRGLAPPPLGNPGSTTALFHFLLSGLLRGVGASGQSAWREMKMK